MWRTHTHIHIHRYTHTHICTQTRTHTDHLVRGSTGEIADEKALDFFERVLYFHKTALYLMHTYAHTQIHTHPYTLTLLREAVLGKSPSKKPCISSKEPCISSKEIYNSTKEPYTWRTHTHTHKHTYTHTYPNTRIHTNHLARGSTGEIADERAL